MSVKDDLGRMWKEAVMDYMKYHSSICLEDMRKITKNCWQDSHLQVRFQTRTSWTQSKDANHYTAVKMSGDRGNSME